MTSRRRPCWVVLVGATLVLGLTSCRSEPVADDSCATRDVTIEGTPGDDRLRGTAGADVIAAGAGDDVVRGLGGDDVLCGGPGADRLDGGAGDDVVDGGPDLRVTVDTEAYEWEGDTLSGGAGDDTFVPVTDAGHDPVDVVTYEGSPRGVDVDLLTGRATGEGTDSFRGRVGTVGGSAHDDRLRGSDRPEVLLGGEGGDLVEGRGGGDRLDAAGLVRVTETRPDLLDGSPNVVLGGPGDDEVTGAEGDDRLEGGDGDDTLYAEHGIDRVRGGAGDDGVVDYLRPTATPGSSRQLLDGGPGRNTVIGVELALRTGSTTGEDVHLRGNGTIDLQRGRLTGRAGEDAYDVVLRGFSDITGPRGAWTYLGTDGPNLIIAGDERRPTVIRARGGDDRLAGSFRDDVLDGGPGRDSASGYTGRDTYVSIERRDG